MSRNIQPKAILFDPVRMLRRFRIEFAQHRLAVAGLEITIRGLRRFESSWLSSVTNVKASDQNKPRSSLTAYHKAGFVFSSPISSLDRHHFDESPTGRD